MITHVPDAAVQRRSLRLMGNMFSFTAIASDGEQSARAIDLAISEVQRIESLLTTYNDSSETASINAAAGDHPVIVSDETFQLIKRSQRISDLTQGAFDISYGSVDKGLWNFDASMTSLPDPAIARAAVRLINYRNIALDEDQRSVFLRERGMRIGFGGIGKGYAAARAAAVMKDAGAGSGIVNAAGDLMAWGTQADGSAWTIAVADPENRNRPFSTLKISGLAVATSGDYEKFVTIGGRKYSHTIDPMTGLPVSGIRSATIICPNAELADALTTPVMIMGVRAGLGMINQMNGIGCIVVDDKNRLHVSNNLRPK